MQFRKIVYIFGLDQFLKQNQINIRSKTYYIKHGQVCKYKTKKRKKH